MQDRHVEVDDQSHALPRQLQVGQQLRFVDAQQSFYRFQFDYDLIGDDQIDAIGPACFSPLVYNGQLHLRQEGNASQPKLMTHTFFINRLQEARTKLLMDLNGSTNDAFGQRLRKKPDVPPCLRGGCS